MITGLLAHLLVGGQHGDLLLLMGSEGPQHLLHVGLLLGLLGLLSL